MGFFYTIGILLYGTLIRLATLFNGKAKKWVKGRQNWELNLDQFDRKDVPLYWFHCASLGEFEQGRPIMEALKRKEDCQLVVSFFSPSGFEIRKNYELADLIFYLPLDTKCNAKKLIHYLRPTKVFIIKYEFWANLISTLRYNEIPVYLISGIFRKGQSFFKWYGGFFRNMLRDFKIIFVQDDSSQQLLGQLKIASVLTGDTRYDRVMENSRQAKNIDLVERFCNGEKVWVIGSSWIEDDQILMPLINGKTFNDKVIIAPHEVKEHRIKQIENQLQKTSIRYSNFKGNTEADVLIIDNIGMLMHLYQYASVAYVGGGFKTGLHNILEPASFGVPVMFGPKHDKFPEATLFMKNHIGFEISNMASLKKTYHKLTSNNMTRSVLTFMNRQTGATAIVLNHC